MATYLLLGGFAENSPSVPGELLLSRKLSRNRPINEKGEASLDRGALKVNIIAEWKQSKHTDEYTCWICSQKMPIWQMLWRNLSISLKVLEIKLSKHYMYSHKDYYPEVQRLFTIYLKENLNNSHFYYNKLSTSTKELLVCNLTY